MNAALVRDFLIMFAAAVVGTLAAEWAKNNSRAVRRAVGSL